MYNTTVLALFNDPKTQGPFPEADVTGQQGVPGEGPYMQIHLKMESDCIAEARFETYGCPAAVASGSWLTRWMTGKTLVQVGKIEANDLMTVLGGLPLGKEHCASLAIGALRSALGKLQTQDSLK